MWEYLHRLNEDGMTMLLTTQYLEEADELVDTLAIIDEGKIVVEGSPIQLKRDIGGDSVVLTLGDDSLPGDLARVEEAMRRLPSTTGVETLENAIAVYFQDGGSRIAEVVRAVDALGVHLGRLELAEPSLDQVFLKHTGARLRVDEVKPQSRISRNRKRT
jgi:ABC-2 type transport system ATP-binding protein